MEGKREKISWEGIGVWGGGLWWGKKKVERGGRVGIGGWREMEREERERIR